MPGRVELRGATALVTGAGSGIGRATAHQLAADGAAVVVTDIDVIAAEKVAAEIGERGGRAVAYPLDVTDAAAVAALADTIAVEHGAVDVVVANAGVGMSGRFCDMSIDDWRWIRNVNLDGVVHTVHTFGSAMTARGRGHVVIVSSGLGFTPTSTEPAYVTTKAAVLALAQCLRADWAKDGVGVTAICPGVIDTPIIDHTRFIGDHATTKDRAKRVFRHGHKPEKVAKAIIRSLRRDGAAIVPVGVESWLGWFLHRTAPVRLQQFFARRSIG